MENSRVFVDCHVLDDYYQGSRSYITGLYKEVLSLNPDIKFFFGAYDIQNLRAEFGEKENLHYTGYKSKNKFFRLIIDIPLIIRKYKIDIAHFQYVLPLFKNATEILTIHDLLFLDYPEYFPFWYRVKNKILFRLSAKRADFLSTVSEYSRNQIALHFGIEINKIFVIQDGISGNYFSDGNHTSDIKIKYNLDRFILSVGRFEPRKNHLILVKAFKELNLSGRGYKLVLIGSKSISTPDLDRYLSDLPVEIKESILRLENIPEYELRLFYGNCDLFVFPSIAEGFGIPPLEAVASGAPVLCSGRTAMADFSFLDEDLFDPHSAEELKTKMLVKLDSNKRDGREMYNFVKNNFSWKNPAEKLSKLLNDIILR